MSRKCEFVSERSRHSSGKDHHCQLFFAKLTSQWSHSNGRKGRKAEVACLTNLVELKSRSGSRHRELIGHLQDFIPTRRISMAFISLLHLPWLLESLRSETQSIPAHKGVDLIHDGHNLVWPSAIR